MANMAENERAAGIHRPSFPDSPSNHDSTLSTISAFQLNHAGGDAPRKDVRTPFVPY
jgi:hypothetical protein